MRLYLFVLGVIFNGKPVTGYLVQMADGTNILIDTGYRPGTFGEIKQPDKEFIRATQDQLVLNQLSRLGLSADDIHYVIATHFDPDHAGYIDAFPKAEVVVQRRHLEAARASAAARFQFTRPFWDSPRIRFREVDGDITFLPGIELIETSGHVAGHQSVLVRLPKTGPILLAIDAMGPEHMTNPESRRASQFDDDEQELRRSTRKLLDIVSSEKVNVLIFGHDSDQLRVLRQSPECYE
jgi:N-acyl homoserine lactone hydrolase